MTWLYGDSSKSTLDINFIDFLRLAIDFSVELLLAEEQVAVGREQRQRLEAGSAEDLARLEALAAGVMAASDAGAASEETPVARFAVAVRRAAAAALKHEVAAVKSSLAEALGKIEARAGRERERSVKALESLLLRYDLPQTTIATQLDAVAGAATARLRATTAFGLEAVLELDIPAANPFAHEVRVDRFMEGLEVKVPEIGGWLRKQSRIVPHKLGKHRIARLSSSAAEMTFELRIGAEPHAAGLDVTISGQPPVVKLLPVAKVDDGKVSVPFEPDADDAAKLLQLSEGLTGVVAELAGSRRALLEARLDGLPLQTHPDPAQLITRMVAAVGPTVREIARNSLSRSELVLRRLLGGDRREEVFVSKSELAARLDALPAGRQAMFSPLGLRDEPEPAAPAPVARANTQPVDDGMVLDAEPAVPIDEQPAIDPEEGPPEEPAAPA